MIKVKRFNDANKIFSNKSKRGLMIKVKEV